MRRRSSGIGRVLPAAALVAGALTFWGLPAAAPATGPANQRIVGGQATTIAEWPWQVALVSSGGGSAFDRQFCGGTLVAPRIVLTAAHCVYREGSGSFVSPASVHVVTGRTKLSSSSGQEIAVSRIHVLRGSGGQMLYNPSASTYDVEVLELAQSSTAGTIKLAGPDERDLWTGGRTAYVTGWGSTAPSGDDYPDGLRAAQVRIFSDAECQDHLGALFRSATMVCAGAPPSRDTCTGDSGGPLVVPMSGGGYRLVGDTSFGLAERCGLSPSAYGRLGDDPLRSAIRSKVLEIAGVDVVGAGGDPPAGGGGGGGSLSARQARDRAWTYSKRACYSNRRCRKYWAGSCLATGAGFDCEVRNYHRRDRRKSTCKRRLAIALDGGAVTATPLTRWSCRRGWHRTALSRRAA